MELELSDFLSEELLQFCQSDDGEESDGDLLLQASELFEAEFGVESKVEVNVTNSAGGARTARAFAAPKTDEEVAEARSKGVPLKTQKDTAWCIYIWEQWREHRQRTTGVAILPTMDLDKSGLNYWLSRFILEVRKQGNPPSEYPPNTLYHICCGIQRYLRWNGKPGIDILSDPTFAEFKSSLDAEMKRLQASGVGSKKKQAEPLSHEDVELLWSKKLLGDATPQSLLDTIVFMNGLFFALRSGKEHRQLRFDGPQIRVIENPGERPYLLYTEDISKNRPGGLKGRKQKPKVVRQHANEENPQRCFVQLYKLYNSLCPNDRPADALYLQPLAKPTPTCWYSNRPYGYNRLAGTVARLCKEAGIPGYKTNHSLRVTNATWLYDSNVDEQLIMERTGHLSSEGVRTYKRTSESQCEALSDILNGSKRPCLQDASTLLPLPAIPCSSTELTTIPQQLPVSSHHQQQIHQAQSASLPGSFCFYQCGSVTINLNSSSSK